jgi:soluble lytic murein transglycosylase
MRRRVPPTRPSAAPWLIAGLALTLTAGLAFLLRGQPSAQESSAAPDAAAAIVFPAEDQGADPLLPYQRLAALGRDLNAVPDAAIEGYLAEFPDTAPAERVRAVYVKRLAAAGRWADLARVYREDDSTERRCLYLRALTATGQLDQALTAERLTPLWLVAQAQPAACEPLFRAWAEQGGLDAPLVWQRIRLAMAEDETRLARQLGPWLPPRERPWLDRWLTLHAKPSLLLKPGEAPTEGPQAAPMLADAIGRLATTNPDGAAEALAAGTAVLATDQEAWDLAHAAVGRALDRAGDARGLALWDRMSERADNLNEQERRLRAGIGRRDWPRIADWVQRMPDRPEKRDRWLYWQGRAQDALGQDQAARATFALAAQGRGLWGLLAADRLGSPYALRPRAVPVPPEQVQRLAADPAVARMRALARLGRDGDLRREWRTLTRGLDQQDLMAAAVVANALGWHDQAILTLTRTNYWDDLDLRFPLAYRGLVEEQAWQTGLPEDWIYAVIRQESVFNPNAASGAGALGLMQLMPGTARDLATALHRRPPERTDLLDPVRNIDLGSNYLAQMRDRFGHAALATAAYNAGPRRVERWRPRDCTAADLWISAIPFEETRTYVERVLAYRIIYRTRLGLAPLRVSDLLPPVAAGG